MDYETLDVNQIDDIMAEENLEHQNQMKIPLQLILKMAIP